MQCTNNLCQLILAVQNYEMTFRVYPPGTINDTGPIQNLPQGYHHNWISQLLPFIEEQNIYNHVDFQVGVYDDKNQGGAPTHRLRSWPVHRHPTGVKTSG